MVSTVKKLVWFSEIKWDYLVTRKQQILTRFPREYEILYIEPYVIGKVQHWLPRRTGNITVLTIPFIKNLPTSWLSRLQDRKMIRWIMAILGSAYFELWSLLLGFAGRDRLIGLSSPHWGKVAARLPGAVHFYDANDAHLDFPGTPPWLPEYLIAYLRRADLCFAVSPEIASKIVTLGAKNVALLGNGVDFEHFSRIQETPEELKVIQRPILGYAGAMDWLDVQLIRQVCASYPDHEIVLIGPEIRPGWFTSQAEFQGLSNLSYLGKVAYQVLPAYVQAFQVAMIPFVMDELTRPLNPNKLYEYSAAGKPVVSMNYSSTIDALRGVIFVGDSREQFIELLSSAPHEYSLQSSQALARAHSWDGIAQEMFQSIEVSIAG